MPKEQEVTILGIDKVALVSRLASLGAQQIQQIRLSVDWYRFPQTIEGQDEWYLRIRRYSDGRAEVTWKGRSTQHATSRSHSEVNFLTGEPDAMAALFEGIGLAAYAHQEKDRTSWKLRGWRLDLDEYPLMAPYLEIEGESEEHIREAMQLLGLEAHETWNRGERILINEKFGLNWYDMRFEAVTV